MQDLKKAIDHISEQIKFYRQTDVMDGNTLVSILQQLTATLFYLETQRAEYHDQFQRMTNQLILGGNSVSRAENEAHIKIPEMYLLRHIMSSAYTVCEALRSQISWIKNEKNNI